MKNYKTTLCGLAVVVAGAVIVYLGQTLNGGALITIGVGLIAAQDGKKEE
jgi:hypothetical protein